MDIDTRLGNYRAQSGGGDVQPTARQGRRLKKKFNRELGFRAHQHVKGERCYRCRPARRPAVALQPMRLSRASDSR